MATTKKTTRRKTSANPLEAGLENAREAFQQIGDDFEELEKRAEKRRSDLEKRVEKRIKQFRTELKKNSWVKEAEKQRKQFEKAADKQRKQLEKRAEKFRKDVEKSAPYKRAEELRTETTAAIEEQVDTLLETLRIANRGEIAKLERKVSGLQRKVRELEKANAA